jgi:phage gp29-like protein
MPQLLDHLGRPITVTKQALSQEVAKAGLTGVRQAWSAETAIAGLTPDRLESILRQANQGDMDALLTLAEEMEERDPHYGAVLATRKLAALGLEKRITWARGKEEDPRAAEIQEACQELIQESCFDDLLESLLDALGKPFAVTETLWNTSANQWRPAQYVWRDPRWFKFDRETGLELRLKSPGHPDGEPLPAAKFAVHLFGRKSGLPARGGLARLVAFSFVCKLYGLKDWLAFAEIFGIPLRLGKYDAAARPEDVEVLKRAVFGLGSDAAAVIPAAMTIDFPSATGAGGPELFHTLVSWIDNQVSKAVLGQTGTTDMQSGGGYAQATVLNEVRTDLLKADARALGATVTRDILTPFVRFNWGAEAPVPSLELVVEEPEDIQVLGEALQRLVPLGLKVDQAEIRKKLKLSEPAADAEVLTPPASPAPAAPAPAEPPPPERRRTALARAGADLARRQDDQAALDELVAASSGGWARDFGSEVTMVMNLVRDATSFEEIQAGLERLAGDLAAPAAARGLASAMFAAAAIARED